MRHDCRHFESRSYAHGDTVRKCNLDLAPNAPWRCPDNCSAFEPRMDAGWTYGSMVTSAAPVDPPGLDDGSAAAVLDEAEDVLNAVGRDVMAELDRERALLAPSSRRRLRNPFRRRSDR